eukprot:TRINITY_DN10889_c0_g2_i4.p2 TRINITY_DN10889_c0_g2~~TRINITY_DN10889_c0_g2_i4.p2  ORF type:complete len:162 (+),score=29.69 TRINITY_DN10889_c0_g2_i4:216-701(+)
MYCNAGRLRRSFKEGRQWSAAARRQDCEEAAQGRPTRHSQLREEQAVGVGLLPGGSRSLDSDALRAHRRLQRRPRRPQGHRRLVGRTAGLVNAMLPLRTEPTDWRRQPGDFEDPLGLGVFDEETFNRELNNGRLAMFTSLGIIANELVTGNDAIEQLGIPF